MTTAEARERGRAWRRSRFEAAPCREYSDATQSTCDVAPFSCDKKIKKLERELVRKEQALAEAAVLLVLREKLDALYQKDADE